MRNVGAGAAVQKRADERRREDIKTGRLRIEGNREQEKPKKRKIHFHLEIRRERVRRNRGRVTAKGIQKY